MAAADLILITVVALLAGLYFFRGALFGFKSSSTASKLNGHALDATSDDAGTSDIVAKMKQTGRRIALVVGSQTGTAEEYAIRIAKEIKSKYGLSSLVADPDEYEFDKLDTLPDDSAIIFVMATYGEGEPTDNAQALMTFLTESPSFSNGDELPIKYMIWGLGNRSYEHFNAVAKNLDKALAGLGATRIGQVGEGDDDKSMEEDYLAWKDAALDALAAELSLEEGGGGDVQDFAVKEVADYPDEAKVYKGELSARALLGTQGIHDAKNPYMSPVAKAQELFTAGERTCVHMEFDIEGSGISYQHGDHVAVWAHNPEREVERMLAILGLSAKRHTVVEVTSLDPDLAKVPFPVPTTYEAILRHYLDIAARAGRQSLAGLAKFGPSESSRRALEQIGGDKAAFQDKVARHYYTVGEALQLVAGDNIDSPDFSSATVWNIPFDRIVSAIPRLGPRFYSISSSPKLFPKQVHITAVVLRYASEHTPDRHVHGLATNFISSIKQGMNGETPSGPSDPRFNTPKYDLAGPRGVYTREGRYRCPVHIRRSNFRLPTSPKVPVIMVGPGTGVAPFRSFVQERVAAAQKTIEKRGGDAAEALADWGNMWLFYGCRKSSEDFLYRDEWPSYAKSLHGKFKMETAISREKFKPDGSKMYVQDLIWEQRDALAKEILDRKATVYICGDAAGMAHDVEKTLLRILTEAKGGDEAAAQREVKLMKDRSKWLLDVWS